VPRAPIIAQKRYINERLSWVLGARSYMDIIENSDEYQNLVEALSKEVADTIIETLKAYSVPESVVEEVKSELAFNICSVIDGGKDVSSNGHNYTPNMAFLDDESENLHCSVHGSFTKDYIYDFVTE